MRISFRCMPLITIALYLIFLFLFYKIVRRNGVRPTG